MANPTTRPANRELSQGAALRAVLALFFLWGFLTCLNDILVPHFRALFTLSYARAVLVPFTFFATCFVFAPVSSIFIERLGYRRTMVVGLLTMGAGALLFLPAAHTARFACFLAAIGVIGAGITVLQAAAGPYVAFLGPPETAPSRFSLALGFNSLGTMVAPLFGSWFILRSPSDFTTTSGPAAANIAARLEAMSAVSGPYLFLGCMLILLAIAVTYSGLPRMRLAPPLPSTVGQVRNLFRHRPLMLGAVTAFLYAGAEVGIGSLLINYLALPGILGVSRHTAAQFATFYWGGAVVGRLFGWHLLQRWRVETVLASVSMGAGTLVAISVVSHGLLAAAALLAVGLCNAMIIPIVVMIAISGLGPLTSRASSVMVSANIGAGLVPLALGALADRIGIHYALAPTVICYSWVVYYALRGSRGHLLQRVRVNGHLATEVTAPNAETS
jgi:FHS family L-fucose permease-like MFS transporter